MKQKIPQLGLICSSLLAASGTCVVDGITHDSRDFVLVSCGLVAIHCSRQPGSDQITPPSNGEEECHQIFCSPGDTTHELPKLARQLWWPIRAEGS